MAFRVLGLLALIWLSIGGEGGAAIVKESQAQGRCDACTSLSVNHTVGSGSDRLVTIDLQWFSGASSTIATVTVGGVSATNVGHASGSCAGYYCGVSSWRFVAPPSGLVAIAVTASAIANINLISTSYEGVDQAIPIGTAQTTSGTSSAPSLTFSSTSSDVIAGTIAITHTGLTLSPANGATQIAADFDTDGFIRGASSYMAGQPSVTYGWTYPTSQAFAMIAFPILPSSGGGSFSTELLRWNDNASNESLFRLQWKHLTLPNYADLSTFPANTLQYTVQYTTELDRCYRIRAENSGGVSNYSNELCTTVAATGPILPTLSLPPLGGGLSDD